MRAAWLIGMIGSGLLAGCGSKDASVKPADPVGHERPIASPPNGGRAALPEGVSRSIAARLPAAPGEHAPSLVAIDRAVAPVAGDVSDGTMLADVDSCATCHPDAAAQWSASAHSFASFGNPIYRVNVDQQRQLLGHGASRHCGGCHDMPLMVDGLMTSGAPIPPDDLRSHSGVTCRLCHGIQHTTKDGNGSYVWSRAPIDAPALDDAAAIARHKQQAAVTSQGTELCVGCHRGFLSPDMGLPVHLSGLDEPGMWRSSAWTGNGLARVDKVEKQSCIDCHMEREPASAHELGAKRGSIASPSQDGRAALPQGARRTIASHRFVGGHTWMAAMRGDTEHLARLRRKLEGVASIDVAGARVVDAQAPGGARWHLPADGAPVAPGTRLELDVVLRNLLAGHRFPGGVLDIQDTWVEVQVVDARGARLAESGLSHATDPDDQDTHVLRTLVVDETGRVLEEHEMAKFRTQVATQTLAAREARAIRYAFDVPAELAPAQLPLTVTARLRHRSRTLRMQAAVCRESATEVGKAFLVGAVGARDVTLDPCRPQPITLVAAATVQLGAGAKVSTARPAWERSYEHGMALVGTVSERLEEARAVLDVALAAAPDDRARAMVLAQLGWVAAKQGRADDALAIVAEGKALMPTPAPPVFDAVAADALARVWRWEEAVAPAKACTERAPQNAGAWVLYARVLGSIGDNAGALAAATTGLELSPRDPDLLRSQATALAALKRPEAAAALAAYERFRSPDNSADLRIACATDSLMCARHREQAQTIVMAIAAGSASTAARGGGSRAAAHPASGSGG